MPHFVFSSVWLPPASATPRGAELPRGHPAKNKQSFLRAEQKEEKAGKNKQTEVEMMSRVQEEGATKSRNTAPSPATVKMWGGFSSPCLPLAQLSPGKHRHNHFCNLTEWWNSLSWKDLTAHAGPSMGRDTFPYARLLPALPSLAWNAAGREGAATAARAPCARAWGWEPQGLTECCSGAVGKGPGAPISRQPCPGSLHLLLSCGASNRPGEEKKAEPHSLKLSVRINCFDWHSWVRQMNERSNIR